MENIEKNKEYTVDDFRKEIEEAVKNPGNAGDFPEDINADALTEEDMRYWLKIKDGSVTSADAMEYKNNFQKENGFENASRYYFLMFAANKAAVVIGKREISG